MRIGNYPGMQQLIDKADAIVILRIDSHIDTQYKTNLFTTHSCYIYQTLKGKIRSGATAPLLLLDTQTNFVTPFSLSSTHLMFLSKSGAEHAPVFYQTMHFEGANIILSPFGHEKMPIGKTIKERVENLIKDSIKYRKDMADKEVTFLEKLLNK